MIYNTAPPLPPNVSVELTSWNTMQLSWDAPFTAEGYPIEKYIVYITNTTTGERRRADIYPSEGTETYTIQDSPSDCHSLQFEVLAESSAGTSTAGQASAGFPVGEKLVQEVRNSEGGVISGLSAELKENVIESTVDMDMCPLYTVNVTVFLSSSPELGKSLFPSYL